jgi:hypothetical protein
MENHNLVLEQGDYVTWVGESGEVLCGKIYLVEANPPKQWVAWILKKRPDAAAEISVTTQPMKNLTKIDPAIYKLF